MLKRKGNLKMIAALFCASAFFAAAVPFNGQAAQAAAKKASKITLNKSTATMLAGNSLKLKASKVSPANASKSVTWKTSNKKLATVTSKGVVKAKKAGTVKITGVSKTNPKAKASCKVTIYNKTKKLTLYSDKNYTLSIDEFLQLEAEVTSPSSKTQPVSWKSSDADIAKISKKGLVKALSEGTAKMTATSGGKSVSVKITVEEPEEYNPSGNETPVSTYIVAFDPSGGSAVNAQNVVSGNTAVKPADPVLAGYTFAGWYKDRMLTMAYDFASPVTENLTLFAKWEIVKPASYQVTFDSNGGSAVAPQTVETGKKAQRPENPKKPGRVFIGWFTDSSFKEAYDFNAAVTQNITLYAKWDNTYDNRPPSGSNSGGSTTPSPSPSPASYTVAFNSNGGSVVASLTVESGKAAAKPADPTKAGFTFGGWYTDAELKQAYDFRTNVSGNITLYAKWNAITPSQPEQNVPVKGLDDNDPDIEIYSAQADIKSVAVKQPTLVTFTANIFANVVLGNEDIRVVAGSTLVGYMKDDGTQGDAVANDGIYTLQASLSSEKEEYAEYQVVAKDVSSEKIGIGFYVPLSDAEIRAMQQVDTQISSLFAQARFARSSDNTKKDAVQNLLDGLAAQDLVKADSIYYDDTQKSFSFQYACGVDGGVSFQQFNDELDSGMGGKAARDTLYAANADNGDSGDAGAAGTDPYKAIVLNGFENTSFRRDFYNSLKNDWDRLGMPTTVDTDVTVADLKALQGYDVVVFAMHGNVYVQNARSRKVPVLCINEAVSPVTDLNYSYELRSRKSVKKVMRMDGTLMYLIMPSFFTDSYGLKELSGKFIYAQPCMFFGCDCQGTDPDYTMARALTGRSAEAVVGYHNSVRSTYGRDVMKWTVERMLEGATVRNALTAATSKYGANDGWEDPSDDKYKAYPMIEGNERFTLGTSETPTQDSGILVGKVLKASDSTPISNALVRVYKDGALVASVRTGSRGDYRVSNLAPGTYYAQITAGHFKSMRAAVEITANQVTYLESALLIQVSGVNSGIANGTITNSVTTEEVGGVQVRMRRNWNNKAGAVLHTTTTNENGLYNISYTPGFYTLELSKEGFVTAYKNIIIGIVDLAAQDANISPAMVEGTYRIVLTWGEDPRDLDSHVVGTLSDNERFHVYFSDKEQYDGDTLVCDLDVDDVTSYGPETVTLTTQNDQPYYYYIHHYSGDGSISSSYAKVVVYEGSRIVGTYNAPTDQGTEIYWNVFAIVNGQLVVKNTITERPDVSYAGAGGNVDGLVDGSKARRSSQRVEDFVQKLVNDTKKNKKAA